MEDNKNKKSEYSGKLQLKKTFNAGQIKQSFSHGRSRSVSVEVKRKRTLTSFKGEENNLNETVPSSDEPEKSLAGPSTQKRETTKEPKEILKKKKKKKSIMMSLKKRQPKRFFQNSQILN